MRAHRLPFRGALVCFALAVFGTVHAESDSIDKYIEAEMDARQAQVMTLRSFGGLTVPEIAAGLGVSVVTVERDRRLTRAWLVGQLGGGDR